MLSPVKLSDIMLSVIIMIVAMLSDVRLCAVMSSVQLSEVLLSPNGLRFFMLCYYYHCRYTES
jgi:hypothetical protein